MKKSLNLILFISLTLIFSIGFILSTATHSILYWAPFIWAASLTYFNWKVLTQFFNGRTGSGVFGVLPGALILLISASLVSVALIFYAAYTNTLIGKLHLISQITLISIFSLVFIFLKIASRISEEERGNFILKKSDLINVLNKLPINMSVESKAKLKSIVEKIEVDMPHDSKLHKINAWVEIIAHVKSIQTLSDENINFIESKLNEI